jgi:hypothetical protein
MSTHPADRRRTPAAATLVGAVLVIAGALLAVTVDMSFMLVVAAGAFGPGALRELGLLTDQDELQREAARAAGYRAYLIGGLAAAALVARDRHGTANLDSEVAGAVALVLMVLMVVWLFSAMFGFWGARRAAVLTLLVFGSFWLAFIVLSHAIEPVALLMESLVAAPFFVLAWTARRWPRVTGVLLLAVALVAFFLFDLHLAFTVRPGQQLVIVLLFIPLVANGIALLRAPQDVADPA